MADLDQLDIKIQIMQNILGALNESSKIQDLREKIFSGGTKTDTKPLKRYRPHLLLSRLIAIHITDVHFIKEME